MGPRFRDLRDVVRPLDWPKLDDLDAALDDIRDKHHPDALLRDDDPELPFYVETDDEDSEEP